MALRGIDMGLALILASMLWARAAAQSGCNSALIGMAPCLNYVTGSSSTPSSSCCSQLASVVKSQPQCLCTVLNGGGASLGVTINQTLALELPAACNVQTPPVSKCNAANGPTTSPVGSPVDSPEGSPSDSSTGSSTSAANGPTTSPVGSPVGSPEGSPSDSSTSSSTSGAGSKTVPSTATTGTSSSNGSIIEMPLQLIFLFIFLAAYGSTCSSF